METFFKLLLDRVDWVVIAIVLLSGLFQARYIPFRVHRKSDKYDSALKTLAVSLLFCGIYIFAVKNPENPVNHANALFSYFAATSLYELIIDPFVDWIKAKTGTKTPNQTPPTV
jgi:hypothetical protein